MTERRPTQSHRRPVAVAAASDPVEKRSALLPWRLPLGHLASREFPWSPVAWRMEEADAEASGREAGERASGGRQWGVT
jgi:hypothetical protein